MSTQGNRILSVKTPLADGAVLLRGFRAEEALSQPFRMTLDLIAESPIAAMDVLGKPMTVAMNLDTGGVRYWSGLVARFEQLADQNKHQTYRAELRPGFWFLTHTSDCKIFQDQTTPEIVSAVLGDHSIVTFKQSLTASYTSRSYCVQYRETDFNFLSRLFEEEGIYYYFTHGDSTHEMVLVDAGGGHQDTSNYETLHFRHDMGMTQLTTQVTHWQASVAVQAAKYVLRDFNYTKSKVDLTSQKLQSNLRALTDLDHYDYPGGYGEANIGDQFAQVRLEELDAQVETVTGQATAWGVTCGATFTLADHPVAAQNQKYLIYLTEIEAKTNPYGSDNDQEFRWDCRFQAGPAAVPFRPPRLTARPRIYGPQTALVVGKDGEEIWTDGMGRIKVQFHWDRYGQANEKSSCWIRVAQPWAGKNWGTLFLPRIGHEVVVEFLDGDPDRPLVTGSVYNDQNPTAATLPNDATQSGILSRSSKNGTPENFNQIRFEDKKGEEEVYIHAEKNFKRVVENDDTLEVGLTKKDKGDQKITIQNDRTTTLHEGNDTLTIEKGNQQITISQGNQEITVTKGNQTTKIEAGTCKIQAGTAIELVVGGSSIKIEPSKITISSAAISIAGSGTVELNAGGQASVKGGATVEIKGGVVMIN